MYFHQQLWLATAAELRSTAVVVGIVYSVPVNQESQHSNLTDLSPESTQLGRYSPVASQITLSIRKPFLHQPILHKSFSEYQKVLPVPAHAFVSFQNSFIWKGCSEHLFLKISQIHFTRFIAVYIETHWVLYNGTCLWHLVYYVKSWWTLWKITMFPWLD